MKPRDSVFLLDDILLKSIEMEYLQVFPRRRSRFIKNAVKEFSKSTKGQKWIFIDLFNRGDDKRLCFGRYRNSIEKEEWRSNQLLTPVEHMTVKHLTELCFVQSANKNQISGRLPKESGLNSIPTKRGKIASQMRWLRLSFRPFYGKVYSFQSCFYDRQQQNKKDEHKHWNSPHGAVQKLNPCSSQSKAHQLHKLSHSMLDFWAFKSF